MIDRRFAELDLTVTFGEYVRDRNAFDSPSVESRVADLHAAFADPEVAGVRIVGGNLCTFNLLHTSPMITFPIGGENELTAEPVRPALRITRH